MWKLATTARALWNILENAARKVRSLQVTFFMRAKQ